MKFANKLQQLRKERGMSQENLAEQIEVSRQAISKWESEQSLPEIDKLIKLSNLFEVSVDELIKDEIHVNTEKKPTSKEDKLGMLIPAGIMLGLALGFLTQNFVMVFVGWLGGIGLYFVLKALGIQSKE